MSPLRATIEVTLMMIAWIIMTLLVSLFANKFTHAQESLSGIFTLNLADETATYTEHNDFSDEYEVEMTASVPENACNRCIRDNGGSVCLDICSGVIYY